MNSTETCAICLEQMNASTAKKGDCCPHYFHLDCMMDCLNSGHLNCPCCRKPLLKHNGEAEKDDDSSITENDDTQLASSIADCYLGVEHIVRTIRKLPPRNNNHRQHTHNIANDAIKNIRNVSKSFKAIKKLFK